MSCMISEKVKDMKATHNNFCQLRQIDADPNSSNSKTHSKLFFLFLHNEMGTNIKDPTFVIVKGKGISFPSSTFSVTKQRNLPWKFQHPLTCFSSLAFKIAHKICHTTISQPPFSWEAQKQNPKEEQSQIKKTLKAAPPGTIELPHIKTQKRENH